MLDTAIKPLRGALKGTVRKQGRRTTVRLQPEIVDVLQRWRIAHCSASDQEAIGDLLLRGAAAFERDHELAARIAARHQAWDRETAGGELDRGSHVSDEELEEAVKAYRCGIGTHPEE